jgi:hypothetical protein
MAKYTITHSCGHQAIVRLFGPGRQRDYAISREEQRECEECYRTRIDAERQQATAKATAKAAGLGLAELSGSPKQIAWAVRERDALLLKAAGELAAIRTEYAALPADKAAASAGRMERMERAYRLLECQAKASYWIDRRGWDGQRLILEMERIIAAKDEQARLSPDGQQRQVLDTLKTRIDEQRC